MKSYFSDYTEHEFIDLLDRIIGGEGTEKEVNALIFHFEKVSEHPAGSDLIFYPENGADDSSEGITRLVKEWRAANGLPGFKSV
ncbi:Colicin-E9 immunity protein [Pseudomonas chlororaphis]|uniref:Bacteriocin immunity protein n=1 Tax=Pseudomonas chlororaphis subsp. aurantiaca TaxID=86192 RepID=A0AAJ1E4E3_9PSED|nr:bacteriocin immunity protein [Pseudomonas chlororaphis]MBU4635614.1 bacteriocin immunity protein [Pseudomonas chlororaphis subsp. aurantiaca]